MTDKSPLAEFGRRKPAPPAPPSQPAKRSNAVLLLLMGTAAVGGAAYTLMSHHDCDQTQPGVNSTFDPQQDTRCRSGSSSSGGGHRYYGSWDSSSSGSSSTSTHATSSSVSRGGFGSIGHVFGFSGG